MAPWKPSGPPLMVASLDGVTPATTTQQSVSARHFASAERPEPLANTGTSIGAPEYAFKNGYAQTWSFGFQREVAVGLVLDAHYWGSKSTRLLETWNIDQLPDQYLSLGPRLNDLVPNPFFGQGSGGVLAGPTISRAAIACCLIPQYTGVQQVYVPAGNSTYSLHR